MSHSKEWITGNIRLSVSGQPLSLSLRVPLKPVQIRAMIPVFQSVTNSVVELGEKQASGNGHSISCTKGCGACCRQLVPLAENETFHLRDLVEQLPEPRRSEVKEKFSKACAQLRDVHWFERIEAPNELDTDARQALGLEYFRYGIACPFLVDESCSIHADRPLACREYLVTSPAENCASPSFETVRMMKIPVKISAAVRRLERFGGQSHKRLVPMIRALEFVAEHDESETRQTGQQWMGALFQEMTGKDPNNA
jgi:Fe-S-cluster containining protein